jgi:hypothetical protein
MAMEEQKRRQVAQPLINAPRLLIEYPPIELFLNSRFSNNGNDLYYNDCTWQLPRAVIAPEGYSLYVQLIDLTLPVSWHVVNEYNNELVINSQALASGEATYKHKVFALTPGNYSVRTLVSTLSNILAPDIHVAFDNITLKLTVSALFPITVSGSLCSVLGIAPGSTGLSLSSLHTVDLTGQNSVYVLSDFSTSNNNIDTRGNSSVFCRIPVTAAPMQVLQHEDYQGLSGLLLDTDTLLNVHLKLEDEEYRPLLCTLHWEATLQIQFVYTGRMHMAYERPLGLIAA